MCMDHNLIFFGGNDEIYYRNIEPNEKEQVVEKDKFSEDIEHLKAHFGDEIFKNGASVELTLAEALSIMPRTRRRTDAYNTLRKYLKEKLDITLNIKNGRS